MGGRRRAFLALLVAALASPAGAQGDGEELIARAARRGLARRPEWRALGHYGPKTFGSGVESRVDAASFFLAPEGKTDPAAELAATLTTFVAAGEAPPPGQPDPRCVFPARYEWLDRELRFDPARAGVPSCPELEAWLAGFDPGGVTLVFPVSYLNNPASMFGHTLLRADPPVEDERTRLLAPAVSFAADTREARGFAFAFRGLTGGYAGRFSVSPYHAKVRTYGDLENRDIWEYRLALTAVEVRRLLLHLWELRPAHFDYYFLDENCSYQLLGLLDVARPGLHLTESFPWWAIPSDTVHAVTRSPGLLRGVTFRPSRRTVLEARARALDGGAAELARRLGVGEIGVASLGQTTLSAVERARVIELALEFAAYRRATEPEAAGLDPSREMALLRARSRLTEPPQTPTVPAPPVRPDQGHPSRRLAAGYGVEDGSGFAQLEFRPAYHDLLDPPGGYAEGGELRFLDVAMRAGEDGAWVRLERLDLVGVGSAAPWDRFVRPLSWKARVGLGRRRFQGGDRGLVGQLAGAVGWTRRPCPGALASLFAEGEAAFSRRFPEAVAPGAGAGAEVFGQGTSRWRVGLSSRLLEFYAGTPRTTWTVALAQRLVVSDAVSLRLDLYRSREFGGPFTGALFGVLAYF